MAVTSPPPRPRKPKIKREDLLAGDCLCDHCVGKCCRYFTLPIETPTSWDDYDAIRWYLAHGRTIVYVEKETWFLVVLTRCKYLTRDDRCRIYLNRPKICTEYTTENCEYDDDWIFTKVFESPEQIWEYARRSSRPGVAPRPPARSSPRSGRSPDAVD